MKKTNSGAETDVFTPVSAVEFDSVSHKLFFHYTNLRNAILYKNIFPSCDSGGAVKKVVVK
jgi:hypothetical protein